MEGIDKCDECVDECDAVAKDESEAVAREAASTAYEEMIKAADSAERSAECGTEPTKEILTQERLLLACKHLRLEYLHEAEVYRLWKKINFGKKRNKTTELTKDSFVEGALRSAAVHSFVVQVIERVKSMQFTVPENYDYINSTSVNYRSDTQDFSKQFEETRQGGEPPQHRDYNFHCHYTLARQEWQDCIVRMTITRHNPQPRPWIVFTCGAMGCGKGYTFEKMSEHGHFPIEDIARVDPDYFKTLMPEWAGYVNHGNNAGTLTHQESIYIQELCQEAALQRRQNIWVDGSLRNARWFEQVFCDIRSRFPHYRIGIIHVHASEQRVRERVRERHSRTGRGVPEEMIVASVKAPPESLFILTPYCDWVARVDNEDHPNLKTFSVIDRSGDWDVMSRLWARTEPAPYEFPNRMAPLGMNTLFKVELDNGFPQEEGIVHLRYRMQESDTQWKHAGPLKILPLFVICIADSVSGVVAKRGLGMPVASIMSAYVHGDDSMTSPFHLGALLYFDRNKKLMSASCIVGHHVRSSHWLEFTGAYRCNRAQVEEAIGFGPRWAPVTVPDMQFAGALRYTWVSPGELAQVRGLGGFLYEMKDNRLILFSVRVPSG